ncbi:aminotransferase class I/II-fold pyridoxal phosphate-dependent enzyme [Spirochaeta cellobiosiphila]|uniref:aminotransferase class I/II-fold pyridoxal phosphate-dependent enzyme n=1 Tax=Spirochaeta cellobiosiphila TaxID=504483 RepID=UPI0004135D7D|nr:aminotransferase class I/II-fold pyridoxal phosphate-dependent enzyme [Spirochaeta cellobiosiphila]
MNKLAVELNKKLEGTSAGALLSDLGQRMYFPKGIARQAGEANRKATRYNATTGMAVNEGEPMILPTVQDNLPRLSPTESVSYAPTPGEERLRKVWKEEMIRKNPGIDEDKVSQPMVVPGLTNGISQTADLFVNAGDVVIMPDMYWGNYNLIFEVRREAEICTFPFFNDKSTFNVEGLLSTIKEKQINKKAIVLLNFPNNPTGYSPTKEEAEAINEGIYKIAEEGTHLLVISDDAYFGLFYEGDIYRESMFSLFSRAHDNILAVKVDGATKEDFVWGFRIGFVTFGGKGLTSDHYFALEEKLTGALRGTISNSSRAGQTILHKELSSLIYHGVKIKYYHLLEDRYKEVKKIVEERKTGLNLEVVPFNSGYFMSFQLKKGSAEDLRIHLLKEEGIGTIAIGTKYLRIAYAAVDKRDLKDLYNAVFEASDKLFG